MAHEADQVVAAAITVVREAFDALERKDWPAAVRLMHPEALVGFQRMQVEHFRQRQLLHQEGQPVHRFRDPTMPPAVAEWLEQQAAMHHEDAMAALPEVFAVGSVDELEALPADEMAIRWLAYNDPEATHRRDVEHQVREQSATAGVMIDPSRVPAPRWRRQVLGGVRESDDTVHVLYRRGYEMPGAPPFDFELAVVTARTTAGVWRLWTQPDHLVGGGSMFTAVTVELSDQPEARNAWLQEMAETVVTWPEAGRAFLRGLTLETRRPEALVVEARRSGETVRMEIPREAFQAVANLISPWQYFGA